MLARNTAPQGNLSPRWQSVAPRFSRSQSLRPPVFPQSQGGLAALIAHRGSPLPGVPQNSRQAFDQVQEIPQTAGLETDLQASRDGYPVVSHDPVLDTTAGMITLAEYRFEELQKFRLMNGEKPLGLEELLERYPQSYLNIDTKSDAVVPQTISILRGRSDLGRLALGSFSATRVWQLARALGPQPGYLPGGADLVRLMMQFAAGLVTSGILRRKNPLLGRLISGYNCALAVPVRYAGIPVVTKRFVASAHQLGCPVLVWTVNQLCQYRWLNSLGVDGIYTDYVNTLSREFLV